ncbi:MAG TPA: glycoside hydrolase family 3 C-terminal domain-containing protein, partial [Anaerolineales bacterium]|nr:glycoside hydrolase family 3 C-terminal domain-containing protein [Anaerolineales bacterium]
MATTSVPNTPYPDPSQETAVRVQDLISHMTLEEKISQMMYESPAIARLGIPVYNWWNEGLHGLARAGGATVFPQAIGLAATWNPELMHQVATAISDEARAKHHTAIRLGIRTIYSGLTYWSPNINLFRDPRWGRGQETYGEDPYLTAQMGVAFIQGLQGDDPDYLKLVATPKHFAVHSGPEPDRHHFDAQISEREMRDFYLFAFEACIKEAKAASIMGAYNRVNGEPACASPTLLEKILREEWGFEGYVVSDCGAIYDIFAHHKVVETRAEAAALAVKNGCDLECGIVYGALNEAVELGLITGTEIDSALERLMTARFRLGMFDPVEQVPYAQVPYEVINSPKHQGLALQAARESIVLLKNENNLLPLSKDIRSIAVIGPNADDPVVMLGNYNGTPFKMISPLEAIRNRVSPSTKVVHAQGCEITRWMPPLQVIPSDCLRPSASSVEFGLRGTYFEGVNCKGDAALSRLDPEINFVWVDTTPVGGQWGDRFSVRWEGVLIPPISGQYKLGANGCSSYNLYLDGDLLIKSESIHHPLRKTKEVMLEAGCAYPIRLEIVNKGLDPQIQLLWAAPMRDFETEALEAVRDSDVIVMVMGLSAYLEGEEMSIDPKIEGFKGGDRTDIHLPETQEILLKKIHALGKPVVLVLMNGSALAISWADEYIPAILEAWYPGQAGGEAIADVLFGEANPGGKLPITFYRSTDDLPPFDDYRPEGHTYQYFRGTPLYPFGCGLSYTTFEIGNLQVDRKTVQAGETILLCVDITNTGCSAGDEVIQVYACHQAPSVPRPIMELKGFRRIS